MLLAIDIGNSNTVFALVEGRHVKNQWRCTTDGRRTCDEYFVWLSSLMENCGASSVDRVIISSVVPNALHNLKFLCRRYLDLEPLVIGAPNCSLPVAKRVDEGAHVGADRLVNTVAAHDLYGGNLIVVDFGTATTFDVVDADGAYAGGAIAPGVELSVRVLHEASAALPQVEISRPSRTVGTNTRDCMLSGIYWGYVGLIEGICNRIRSERDREMRIVGTGGLANLFGRQSSIFDEVNGDLTVYGLALVSEFNREPC